MDPIEILASEKLSSFLEALERLRQSPRDNSAWNAATNEGLHWIVEHISIDEKPLGPDKGHGHLYCWKGFRIGAPAESHAQHRLTAFSAKSMSEARAFLLRLISFKPKGLVSTWRTAYEDCIQVCPDCAVGLADSTIVLADKWLSLKFPQSVVSSFVTGIRKAVVKLCTDQLILQPEEYPVDVNVGRSLASASTTLCLSKIPPGLVALILSQPGVLLDQAIWPPISRAMALYPPTKPLPNLFLNILPGLSLLAMASDSPCAQSAQAQLQHLADQKTSLNAVTPGISTGIQESIREVIGIINRDTSTCQSDGLPLLVSVLGQQPTYQDSWRSLLSILQALPHFEGPVSSLFFTLKSLIISHLGDHGHHINTVLQCFGVLLRALDKSFWKHSKERDSTALKLSNDYLPHQALSQILTNNSFTDSLSHPRSPETCAFWLIPLICSASSDEESLATMFTQLHQVLLCELQKEKVELQTRIHAADIALIPWSNMNYSSDPSDVFRNVYSIVQKRGLPTLFLGVFIDIAYQTRWSSPEWEVARTKAQFLIEHITLGDADRLVIAVREMAQARSQLEARTRKSLSGDVVPKPIEITITLWTQLYQICKTVLPSKVLVRLYSLLIRAVSRCAHIDQLASKSWLPRDRSESLPLKSVWEGLNKACDAIRAPLVDSLLDLSESTPGSEVVTLVTNDKRVMEALVVLILSPHDGLHLSALSLARQWSDCTSRFDCLRFLLSKGTTTAFQGLLISLAATELHTKILPDAMSLARRFVRCMTDILEILCSRSEGLFSDANFMRSITGSQVVQLWNLMCLAVSNIFQRTPYWSQFWATADMTDWMRDALIFSEQLVHQFHAFEDASAGGDLVSAHPAVARPSDDPIRQQMVDSFMRPTEAILSWLRLTEPDLLDRSASVLATMLEKLAKFRRPLKSTIVEKLEKYLERNRQSRFTPSQKMVGVVLTEQQCGNIKKALASHPDLAERFAYASDDDDMTSATILDQLMVHDQEQLAYQKAAWGRVLDGNCKDSLPKRTAFTSALAPRTVMDPKQRVNSIGSSVKLDLTSRASKSLSSKSYGRHDAGSSSGLLEAARKNLASRQPFNRTHGKQAAGPSTERTYPQSRTRFPSLPNSDPIPVASPTHSNPELTKNQRETQRQTGAEGPHLISDESEISEDDKALDAGLAALVEAQKPKIMKPRKIMEPRRTIKIFKDPTIEKYQQVVKAKQQKQAQMKLEKLKASPDFTMLHRHILQWDYNYEGEAPPNTLTDFNRLPASFNSFNHYLHSLEPLLMCECWQQICQAKEAVAAGEKTPVSCEITGRTSVDDFVEMFATIPHGALPDRLFLTEADLVLFKAVGKPASHCVMAKVINLSRKPECFELNVRMHFGNVSSDVSGFLVPKTKWEVLHLCSLSTTHREWAALRSLQYLTLGDDILEARVTPPVIVTDEQLSKVMQCQKVNEPQGRAIISSLATSGFSLIQGPPGTGKTSTIVGLIGAFIASRPKVTGNPDDAQSITRKILLCAPSNAAVDEVAKRLKDGVRGAQGELIIPKLVRIGADSKVNVAVKDIFIDELVEAQSNKLESNKSGTGVSGAAARIHELRQLIADVREIRNSKQLEAEQVSAASPLYTALQQEVTKARRRIHELSQQLDEVRDQQAASKRYLDAATRRLRMQILQDADVVCSTLSGSGHDYMSQLPFDFETVVIDEACQCVEPASLIPLRYNATQCILVGDPLQLPPTVLSQIASKAGYDQSLFVRMQQFAPHAVHLLSIQYRMHPSISSFPSKAFYQSRLMDGPDMASKTAQRWHSDDCLFPPYAFYHPIGAREERNRHHSFINRLEAGLAVAIYSRLTRMYPDIDFAYRIGIITAYAGQVGEIRRQFRQAFPAAVVATLDINTVDGFQGQEKDIIILSCVRGGLETDHQVTGIGFLKDTRRMNVALTRAKSSLFIIGNQATLVRDKNWKALIDDAIARDRFSEVSIDTFNSTSSVRNTVTKRSFARAPGQRVATLQDEDAGLELMTPQQMSQQSRARVQAARKESNLKRKTSTEKNSVTTGIAKKARGGATGDVQKSFDSPPPPDEEDRASTSLSTAPDREAGVPPRPLEKAASTRVPNVGSSSSSHKPSARPGKKGPVSLFIKNNKRPARVSGPQEADPDTRSVKQRLQDEMKMMRKPAP